MKRPADLGERTEGVFLSILARSPSFGVPPLVGPSLLYLSFAALL